MFDTELSPFALPSPRTGAGPALADEVERIIAGSAIAPHFQPIVDLSSGQILGFEGLTRGPSDSFLHSPVALFEAAVATGRLFELERCAIRSIVSAFGRLQLPGRLFINVSPQVITEAAGFHDALQETLRGAGLAATRIVVELTETHAVHDTDRLLDAIAALRALGLVVALDDLGEGFSSLKRWTVVRPDFVKIDRHFVDGLSQDPLRQQFIRSILDMARSAGCHVVAEGVETESDLAVLRELGMHSAQGYLFAKPTASPRTSVRPEIVRLLGANGHHREGRRQQVRAGHLARPSLTVTVEVSCDDVLELFRGNPQLHAVPVLDELGRPIGVLRSLDSLARGSRRYFAELFGRQSCIHLMDSKPLAFDVESSLSSMAEAVANVEERHLIDGFIVTREGRYWGTGRISDLLRAVSDSQLFAARYANPLTQLPGNVPLDEHVDGLLDQQVPFVVGHWDISSFKAFNDVYGYRAGDDMIGFTAQVLSQALHAEADMLGHVGGDDFVGVMTSTDWEARIGKGLALFDAGVRRFYSPEHLAAGGFVTQDRRGQEVFHPLATLAVGVVPVRPGQHESHRQISRVAADMRQLAKRARGSAMFVDRRASPQATAERA
ncbi:GGDEF domain-containing protein [Ideonella sp.]|uniref:GGDEF domain-containing protein n=1 Tax=Ideonella sp. TaxID=1929293 RepID=UPI002B48E1CD|nr:GGDEF domain-containing protein [Ideonella sp.]HJV71258.1 GGDEF domain-containing protein [Ideonella sp.]